MRADATSRAGSAVDARVGARAGVPLDGRVTQRCGVAVCSNTRLAAAWRAGVTIVAGWLTLAALGCGGSAPAAASVEPATPAAPVTDTRTPIDRRRDAACDQLGAKLTSCAVEDARANLAAGKIDQAQYDRDTAPAIQRKNTDEFDQACKRTTYSSRQIRVLEVCFQQEHACASLLDCLGHLSDAPAP